MLKLVSVVQASSTAALTVEAPFSSKVLAQAQTREER